MPNTELLLAFFAATALFAYMPGPAMLYTAAQTLSRGRRAGFMAAFGIHTGGYFHVIAAALGLSAIFHAIPILFTIVKIAGALYLMWLGGGLVFKALRGGVSEEESADGAHAAPSAVRSARRAFFDSIVVEILNPKAALFFLAFLPQFVDPTAAWPLWLQLAILGTIVNVMFSSADVLCVIVAGTVQQSLSRSNTAQRVFQAFGGSVLIGLGAKLALQRGS